MPPEYTPEELIEESIIPTTPLPRDPGWRKPESPGEFEMNPLLVLLLFLLLDLRRFG